MIINNTMPCPNHNMEKKCSVQGCTNLGMIKGGRCRGCGGKRRRTKCAEHYGHSDKLHSLYSKYRKDTCEKCGKKAMDTSLGYLRKTILTVHHIDHNRQNNDPSNLMTLCRYCHDKEHGMR